AGLGGDPTPSNLPPLPTAAPTIPLTMEEELDSLSAELRALMKEILDENHEQAKIIAMLASKAEKEQTINSVMAEKIRAYSEDLIKSRPVKKEKHEKEGKHDKEGKHKEGKEGKAVKA